MPPPPKPPARPRLPNAEKALKIKLLDAIVEEDPGLVVDPVAGVL